MTKLKLVPGRFRYKKIPISIEKQRQRWEEKRQREKDNEESFRKMIKIAHSKEPGFTAQLLELHSRWRGGDEIAGKLYFSYIGYRGGKAGRGEVKQRSGRMGGISTKSVTRKEYVKGEKHGNTGKKRVKVGFSYIPTEKEREASLAELQARIAFYLENPGAYSLLAGDPSWKPSEIPADVPVIDNGGRDMRK